MGPGRAADIIREGLFRGADNGYLLTDRAFAGADTLATSYALATAIRKIGDCDIIIGGRQAIDGDTAQVGPQEMCIRDRYGNETVELWFQCRFPFQSIRRLLHLAFTNGSVQTVSFHQHGT